MGYFGRAGEHFDEQSPDSPTVGDQQHMACTALHGLVYQVPVGLYSN
jgi:hypothetical protein